MQANRGDPDQMPHSVVSNLGLHYLPMSHKKDTLGIYGLKNAIILLISQELQKFGKYIVEISESARGTSDLSKFIKL